MNLQSRVSALEGAPVGGGWRRWYLEDLSDAELIALRDRGLPTEPEARAAALVEIGREADELEARIEFMKAADGHTYCRERRQTWQR